MSQKQIRSKKRVADHGEVFTNDREINAMLDLVETECERIESRFLEPACGNGNFLSKILERKLSIVVKRFRKNLYEYEVWSFIAVMSIYGVELLEDNINECIDRLYKIYSESYKNVTKNIPDKVLEENIRFVLKHNILQGDALTMLRTDGTPTIFAQWDKVNGDKFQRHDYRLDQLMHEEGKPQSLVTTSIERVSIFGNNVKVKGWHYDVEVNAFLPDPIKSYPLTSYRRLKDYD